MRADKPLRTSIQEQVIKTNNLNSTEKKTGEEYEPIQLKLQIQQKAKGDEIIKTRVEVNDVETNFLNDTGSIKRSRILDFELRTIKVQR